jgi:acetyltransferase-like isoleucine patch superfamily enzyme
MLKPFYLIKRHLVKKKIKYCGNNFIFNPNSSFFTPQFMEIGNHVFIGEYAHIAAKIKIGNNVMIGPRVVIVGGNHYFGVCGKSNRFLHPKNTSDNYRPIIIEDDVWCGACVVILGGVIIGMGAIIAAASIVVKSIPPFTLAAGNICKPKKIIFDNDTLTEHLLKMEYSTIQAKSIVFRRENELKKYNLNINELPIVNNTQKYQEINDSH